MLQVLVFEVPVIDIFEKQLAPSCSFIPAGAVIFGHRKAVLAEQILIDSYLALPALLLGMVRLLGPEVLQKQRHRPPVAKLQREDFGRKQRRKRARLAFQTRNFYRAVEPFTQ